MPADRTGSLGRGKEVRRVLAGVPSPGDNLRRDTDCELTWLQFQPSQDFHQATAVAAAGLQGAPPSANRKFGGDAAALAVVLDEYHEMSVVPSLLSIREELANKIPSCASVTVSP